MVASEPPSSTDLEAQHQDPSQVTRVGTVFVLGATSVRCVGALPAKLRTHHTASRDRTIAGNEDSPMNPWPTLFIQSLTAGVVLSGLAALDRGPFQAIAAVFAALLGVCAVALGSVYFFRVFFGWLRRRQLSESDMGGGHSRLDSSSVSRTRWRRHRDPLVVFETALAVVPPLTVVLALGHDRIGGMSVWYSSLGIVLAASSAFFAIVFASSLVDWFVIRPRRDGLICLPPCWDPENEHRWYRVTRTWFRHRMIADLAFALLFPVTGVVIVFHLGTNTSGSGWLTRGIGLVFTLGTFGTRYAWRRVRTGATAVSNSGLTFRLGQTISWKLRDADRPEVFDLSGGSLMGIQLRFAVGRAHKRPPADEYWLGSGGFVLDVSTKEATIVHAASTRDGRRAPREKLPVARLLQEGCVTKRTDVKYCGIKALGGACRSLHPECERDPARRSDNA